MRVVYQRRTEGSAHAQSMLEQTSILQDNPMQTVHAVKAGYSGIATTVYSAKESKDSWNKILTEQWDQVKQMFDFDPEVVSEYIFFGSPIPSDVFSKKAPARLSYEKFLETNTDTGLSSNFVPLLVFLGLLKYIGEENFHKIHYVLFDPEELWVPKPAKRYFGYKWRDFERLDSLQYHYENQNMLFYEPPEKTIEYTFGLTVVTSHRQAIYDKLVEAGVPPTYVKHKWKKVNTEVPRHIYMDQIERSKFTMIIPAGNPDTFSIYRFIESLQHNCLPLITADCCVEDVEKSFNIDLSPIVVEYSDLKEKMSTLPREELLEKYKAVFLPFERTFT